MTVLLSPAKNLNANAAPSVNGTEPIFMEEAAYLAAKLAKKSERSLAKLMGINKELAALNFRRYQDWTFPFQEGKAFPALYLFAGDVYRGLDAASFNKKEMEFAQQHVRILSGLYGLLRPKDAMMPYRLDMGTKWSVTPSKKNLYTFWGDKLTDALNAGLSGGTVLNLASNEYAKAINRTKLHGRMVNPVFKEWKNGTYRPVMTYAKLARGYMCRFVVQNGIVDVQDIKDFSMHGYTWNRGLSTEDEWVFTRDKVE